MLQISYAVWLNTSLHQYMSSYQIVAVLKQLTILLTKFFINKNCWLEDVTAEQYHQDTETEFFLSAY